MLAAGAFLWSQLHPTSHQLMQAILVAIELSTGYSETKRKAARGVIRSGRSIPAIPRPFPSRDLKDTSTGVAGGRVRTGWKLSRGVHQLRCFYIPPSPGNMAPHPPSGGTWIK